MDKLICLKCNGAGFYEEHAEHPHPDGDCLGCCPIALECNDCEGKGFITSEMLFRKEQQKRIEDLWIYQKANEDKNLPF